MVGLTPALNAARIALIFDCVNASGSPFTLPVLDAAAAGFTFQVHQSGFERMPLQVF